MWSDTAISRLFGVAFPIVQAPMAGGADTPALVAAVSEAGGMGSIGAAYLQPEAIREQIRATRRLTQRPFAVNLFALPPNEEVPDKIARGRALLESWRNRFSLADELPAIGMPDFAAQLAVVLEEKPAVFSFVFGRISPEQRAALKQAGIKVVGTATTAAEAKQLEADGVDAICAQGSEAGAHRGSFLAPFEDSMVGLMALVPTALDRIRIPMIAAGGIMDGRGIAAALTLGAEGVQMGTAFLVTEESGASPAWKNAILNQGFDSTKVTRAFSGRPARGIRNAMMTELDKYERELPGFPAMNTLTRGIRNAAAKAGDAEALSLWAGQAASLARPMPAGELLRLLARETSDRFDRGFQG